MNAKKKKVAVYIGRFQPYHLGHKAVLDKALKDYDFVVVCIGSSHGPRTVKNPFTYEERREMIHDDVTLNTNRKASILYCAIHDSPYNDNEWVAGVQHEVNRTTNMWVELTQGSTMECEYFIIGSDRDASTWYLKAFPNWKLDLSDSYPEGGNMNATELRKRWFTNNNGVKWVDNFSFQELPESSRQAMRKLMCGDKGKFGEPLSAVFENLLEEEKHITAYKKSWESAPYAPTFVTADAVVIQSGCILAVERGQYPGKGLWALPGGFIGQNERVADAAIRELVEETGLKVPVPVLRGSVKATEVFDHPDRSLRGRTITFASLIQLDDTKPLPRVKGQNVPAYESDGEEIIETAKAFWLPLSHAMNNSHMWFEDHHSIVKWAVAHHNFSSASPFMKR